MGVTGEIVESSGLSERLRADTWPAHEEAEHAPFMQDLVAGRLPVSDYARLVAQHAVVYEALERAVAANADPRLDVFFVPELNRLDAIHADLEFLVGPGWRDLDVMPATAAYRDHLDDLRTSWPVGLLAHHYVRYLGDLSGGQIIGRVLRRALGLEDERGTSFYRFDTIPSAKAFKENYRANLDALKWSDDEVRRFIDEAILAFRANTAIVAELSDETSARAWVGHRVDVTEPDR